MKKVYTILLLTLFCLSCNKSKLPVNLQDKDAVTEYLLNHGDDDGTFYYNNQSAQLESILQFLGGTKKGETIGLGKKVNLSISMNGNLISQNFYDYELGEIEGDDIVINIIDSDGKWKLNSKDGKITLDNNGNISIYNFEKD